jgi:hypothetical protein
MNVDYDFVQIDNSTFKSARREYGNWTQAWVREVLQNSIDAKANWLEIKIENHSIEVYDNGCGMDESILRNKLFVVNASSKNCESSQVGGFGKAKELLFFGQKSYEIWTNELYVHGYANRFKIRSADLKAKGTRVKVLFDESEDFKIHSWEFYFKQFFQRATWSGSVLINGEIFNERCEILETVHDFSFGKLHRKTGEYDVIVRINGMPMYESYCAKASFVLDLEGKSYDLLNSNRDGLKDKLKNELSEWLWSFAKNTSSALLKKKCNITIFRGINGLFSRRKVQMYKEGDVFAAKLALELATRVPKESDLETRVSKKDGKISIKINKLEERQCRLSNDFILQNSSDTPVPSHFYPDNFSINAKWVLDSWNIAIMDLHELFDLNNEYMTGFIFCNEIEACIGRFSGSNFFLINPVMNDFGIKFQKKRHGCCSLLSKALHEFVHIWHQDHDEDFSNKHTDFNDEVLNRAPHIIKKMLRGDE